MAKTTVENLTLTVTTVEVFVRMMNLINDNDLWDDALAYLKENGKTEMFFDYEVLFLFREMFKGHPSFDPDDAMVRILLGHGKPPQKYCEKSKTK